ncbi:MAG: phosphate acyltransferase PlsX [Vicinamibacterales bacterium]
MKAGDGRTVRVAVDAMGGDHAPARVVDGALAAARHSGVAVTLVGRRAEVEAQLVQHPDAAMLGVDVVDAPDVVAMDESPASALRRKSRASIRVAAELVGRGDAQALVSAGHTGATVVASHGVFGMLAGVDRPALAPAIPTQSGMAVLLDAGATVECRPHHLLQFGVMGNVYAETLLGLSRPRVGVLSIGEEEGKGNELTREAYRLLKAAPLAFVGNVEARDVFAGTADVIVCDGFTGNVALKLSEGLVETVEALLGAELASTFSSQVGYLLSRRAFRRFRRRLDYSEYGGAPLLGVSGLVFVCHGRSSVKAIRNAVVAASRFAADGIVARMERRVADALVGGR